MSKMTKVLIIIASVLVIIAAGTYLYLAKYGSIGADVTTCRGDNADANSNPASRCLDKPSFCEWHWSGEREPFYIKQLTGTLWCPASCSTLIETCKNTTPNEKSGLRILYDVEDPETGIVFPVIHCPNDLDKY